MNTPRLISSTTKLCPLFRNVVRSFSSNPPCTYNEIREMVEKYAKERPFKIHSAGIGKKGIEIFASPEYAPQVPSHLNGIPVHTIVSGPFISAGGEILPEHELKFREAYSKLLVQLKALWFVNFVGIVKNEKDSFFEIYHSPVEYPFFSSFLGFDVKWVQCAPFIGAATTEPSTPTTAATHSRPGPSSAVYYKSDLWDSGFGKGRLTFAFEDATGEKFIVGLGHSALWGWPGSPPIATEVPFPGNKDSQIQDKQYYTKMESMVHMLDSHKPIAKTVFVALGGLVDMSLSKVNSDVVLEKNFFPAMTLGSLKHDTKLLIHTQGKTPRKVVLRAEGALQYYYPFGGSRVFSPIMQMEHQLVVERTSDNAIELGESGAPVTTESGHLVGMAIARGQYPPPESAIDAVYRPKVDLGRYAVVTPVANILNALQWFNQKLL